MKRSNLAGIGPALMTATLACVLVALSLSACSSETDDTSATLAEYVTTIPTLDALAGTWVRDYSYLETDEGITSTWRVYERLVVATDGSYTLIEGDEETPPSGHVYYDYSAQKGTISASSDGIVTRTYSKTMTSRGSASSAKLTDVSDSAPWVTASSAVTEAYPWRLIDGALATQVYVRSGTGSGITGEWSEQDTRSDKATITITEKKFIDRDYNFDDSTWVPDGTWTLDYTIVDDHTLSLDVEGEDPQLFPVYLSGDVFVGDKPEERFVKQ